MKTDIHNKDFIRRLASNRDQGELGSGQLKNSSFYKFVIRDDDSDDEIDDQDVHKIMIVTQTPPSVKKYDRTGNFVTRVKMTQELSKAINDGLYYYEQVK